MAAVFNRSKPPLCQLSSALSESVLMRKSDDNNRQSSNCQIIVFAPTRRDADSEDRAHRGFHESPQQVHYFPVAAHVQ